jgi:hypothetical protein
VVYGRELGSVKAVFRSVLLVVAVLLLGGAIVGHHDAGDVAVSVVTAGHHVSADPHAPTGHAAGDDAAEHGGAVASACLALLVLGALALATPPARRATRLSPGSRPSPRRNGPHPNAMGASLSVVLRV